MYERMRAFAYSMCACVHPFVLANNRTGSFSPSAPVEASVPLCAGDTLNVYGVAAVEGSYQRGI